MESKKEALLKEASENSLTVSRLEDKLAELDSTKPHPYGTIQAVGIFSFLLPLILIPWGFRVGQGCHYTPYYVDIISLTILSCCFSFLI